MFIRVVNTLILSTLALISSQGIAQTVSTDNAESISIGQDDTTVVAMLFGKSITIDDIMPNEDVLAEMQKQASNRGEFNSMLTLASLTELSEQIIEGVLEDYAAKHNIIVDQSLVDKFKEKFVSAKSVETADATAGERSALGTTISNDEIAQRQVIIYLSEKHMYHKFGGTVVFRQFNPQFPIGAYFNMLKGYQKSGEFEIVDDSLQEGFWLPFTPPYQYELAKDTVDFSKPWWM